MSNIIDLTPVGCRTPGGVARVTKAMEAWQNSQAELANGAMFFLKEYADDLRRLMTEFEEDSTEAIEELNALEALIATMVAKQEEFVLAVAGRPSRKS